MNTPSLVIGKAKQASRDDFALACVSAIPPPSQYVGVNQTKESYKDWARRIYRMADALMEQRSK